MPKKIINGPGARLCIRRAMVCFFAPVVFFLLHGCTAMKFVPEHQVLYTGANVKLEPEGRVRAKKKIKELLDVDVTRELDNEPVIEEAF